MKIIKDEELTNRINDHLKNILKDDCSITEAKIQLRRIKGLLRIIRSEIRDKELELRLPNSDPQIY